MKKPVPRPLPARFILKGQLKFVTDGGQTKVEIKLEREHGGCGNVRPFAAEDGGGMLMETSRGRWFAVRVVSAKKAYFYSRPSLSARKKQYVVSHDPIRIFQVKNSWVEAEFGAEKTTRGWIRMSDLFPSVDPEKTVRGKRCTSILN